MVSITVSSPAALVKLLNLASAWITQVGTALPFTITFFARWSRNDDTGGS